MEIKTRSRKNVALDGITHSNGDEQILSLLHENREQGFHLLFDVYHMPLCIYAVQLTDSFQLAEDIVQDFLISFWEKKYYQKIYGNLKQYLFTSVRHASLAELKKRNLVSMEELTGVPVEIPLEDALEREELELKIQELRQRLSCLSSQETIAIQMVILENKKCVEAAEKLQISVNTLKTYLSRALKKLRKEYDLSLLLLLS